MITLDDCYCMSEAPDDVVSIVARHQRLSPIMAMGFINTFLAQPWGGPAIRQMILDEYARADGQGNHERAYTLAIQYREARARYPQGRDRRRRTR